MAALAMCRQLSLAQYSKPRMIVSDNGTELTSNAILRWADDHKVAWHYIAPVSIGFSVAFKDAPRALIARTMF
jgi:transposase InsO family protein